MYEWKRAVLIRDDFRDWFSGSKGTVNNPVEAHHIIRFSTIMKKYNIKSLEEAEVCEELWDTNNGITILRNTHKAYHNMWGK